MPIRLPLLPTHLVHGREDSKLHLRVDEGLCVRGEVPDEAIEVNGEPPGLEGFGEGENVGDVWIDFHPGAGAVLPRLEAQFWSC